MKLHVFYSIFFLSAVALSSERQVSKKNYYNNSVLLEPLAFATDCLVAFESNDKNREKLESMCGCEGGPIGCIFQYLTPRAYKEQNDCCCLAQVTCACCVAYPCYFACCYRYCYAKSCVKKDKEMV